MTLLQPFALLQGRSTLLNAVGSNRLENASSLIQAGANVDVPETNLVGWEMPHDHGTQCKHLCCATCVL